MVAGGFQSFQRVYKEKESILAVMGVMGEASWWWYIPRLENITSSMAVLVASTITPVTERKVSSSPTTDQ